VDVYDGVPTIVTSFIAILPKISIIIFIVILYKGILKNTIGLNYIFLLSSFGCLLIGSILGLIQYRIKRLLTYSSIVRRCALFIQGVKDSMHCSQMHPTSELGREENPKLNIAFPLKWLIRLIQLNWLVTRVVFSMIRAKLLEVHLQGSSSIGNYLYWYRVVELNKILKLSILLWTNFFLGITNTFTAESGQSKENLGINIRTTGLPKVKNGYGNREIVVPLVVLKRPSIEVKTSVALGRISGWCSCSYSNTAGDSSTVKSDAIRKLRWLGEKCELDKKFQADDIYRLMFNKRLYEIAYDNLKSKSGNMTPGVTPTTLDGFSSEIIDKIIDQLKKETFKFSPGRRVMIPKGSGGERPFTIAPPRNKIVQEVMRMILELIFEPEFSNNSHGFRPNRSCHTALRQIKTTFGVASWYIEGDISKCFDSFSHEILIKIIRRRVKDERFIRLIIKTLNAGYFEFKEYKHSITGTPQGSIISPLLSNIYLNEFDNFIGELIKEFSIGQRSRSNPLWISYQNKKTRTKTILEKIKWHKLLLKIPSKDPQDPYFKKLIYVRYADDWILGVRGSHEDCENILIRIKEFLSNKLEFNLSESKTLITNANNQKALFLGTLILRSRHQGYHRSLGFTRRTGRQIRLELPLERVVKKLTEAKFIKNKIASPKFIWLHNSKDQIIALYNSVYRGYINYYSFANNLGINSGYIHSTLKSSCVKLLAAKFTLKSQSKVYKEFGKDLKGKDNISFVKPIYTINVWDFKGITSNLKDSVISNGLIKTLYAESISVASLEDLECSICNSNYRVEMHHVRQMKDLNPK